MKTEIIDTNKKNIGQSSQHNPGWKGSGVPTLKLLISRYLRGSKKAILAKKRTMFINKQLEFFSNLKTFIFSKNNTKAHCPCCNWSGSGFITMSNYRAISYHSKCPSCDSRSRHRGLVKLLTEQLKNNELDLLFFAPELIITKLLAQKKPKIKVKTTDYYSTDVDYENQDIQNLSIDSNSFDYILCNHVIEHVPNDNAAFKECARILKENGKAFITIPGDYHLQDTIEYEQPDGNGHFRHYGLDVTDKMKQHFTKVETVDLNKLCVESWKIKKNELVFVCHK